MPVRTASRRGGGSHTGVIRRRILAGLAEEENGYLMHDTFTDDDDVTIVNHTPDVDPGEGWIDNDAGLFGEILGNRAENLNSGTSWYFCWLTSGLGNGFRLSGKLRTDTITGEWGWLFRHADNNNYFMVRLCNTQDCKIKKNVATSKSDVATESFTFAVATDYNFVIEVTDGNLCSVWINEALIHSAVDIGTDLVGNTNMGLVHFNASAANKIYWDDFIVEAL